MRSRDSAVVARVADVYAAIPSMTGKFELEYEGEMRGADNIARELIRAAVGKTFTKYFKDVNFQAVVQWFEIGGELKVPANAASGELLAQLKKIQGLFEHLETLGVRSKDDAAHPGERGGVHSRRTVGAQARQPQRGTRLFRRDAQDARAARTTRAFGPHAAAPVQLACS